MNLLILTLLVTLHHVKSESLAEFPLSLDNGNQLLQATLTDMNSGRMFFLKEFIYTADRVSRGKIEITSDSKYYYVHYSTKYSKQRLLIHEYECDKLVLTNGDWRQISSDIDSFSNLLLLLGPSVFHRLKTKSLNWIPGSNETIRGVFMNSLTTKIQDKLSITLYYKSAYDQREIPSRIEFVGKHTGDFSSVKGHLVMDIYSVTYPNKDLEPMVTVQPGIGCPVYLSDDDNNADNFPSVFSDQLHFIMRESFQLEPKSSTLYEIYVDTRYDVMKVIKTLDNGTVEESFYDLDLKLIYRSTSEGVCSIENMDRTSLGVSFHGKFSLYHLVYFLTSSEYLGKTFYGDESHLKVEAFEAIEHKKMYAGVTYDKLVITKYFAKSDSKETLRGYKPVGVTLKAYNKDSKGKLFLVQNIQRHIHDFVTLIEEEEFKGRFRPSDCHLKDQQIKTFAIHFKCEDDKNEYAANVAKARATVQDVVRNMLGYNSISLARLANIEYDLTKEDIVAYVSISSMPSLEYLLKLDLVRLSYDFWGQLKKNQIHDATTCLSYANENAEAVAYDPVSKLCASIDFLDYIKYSVDGISVDLYYTPLKNVGTIIRKSKTADLFVLLSKAFKNRFFHCHYNDCHLKFTGTKVEDVTPTDKMKEAKELIVLVSPNAQLSKDANDQVISIPDVKTFTDCYKSCLNSETNDCQTFSYCDIPTKSECRVSSLTNQESKKVLSDNSSCMVYSKNNLYDYIEIKNRKFKVKTTISITDLVENCASFCYPSKDCRSFQVCGHYSQCSFAEVSYTDSNTEYSDECSIYIPKIIDNYQSTGEKIVSQSLHTELGLNIDQCAALCHSWSDDDGQACLSFNYCPNDITSSTICNINKDSVKVATNETIESDNCQTYLRKTDEKKKQKNTKIYEDQVDGISKAGAFGIIMIFLATGAIFGAAIPFIMSIVKRGHTKLLYKDENDTMISL